MTAIVEHTMLTAVTDKVAAADHIPTAAAHHLVDTTAPIACAELLHRLANEARQSVRTTTGQYLVVRADDLLRHAAELEAQAAVHLAEVVDTALTVHGDEHRQVEQLRAEVEMLRDQLGAVIDETVRHHLIRCDYIGEHPLTDEQRADIEADVRATWAAIALAGGA